VNVVFTFKSAADKGAVKTALSSSFKEKYGKSFLRLDVSTTKPSRRRLEPILRRRLATTTFYITVVLAGKASDLSSGITDFVSNGLVASLKKQNLCSDTKPCTVEKPVISATKGSGSGGKTKGSGSGGKTKGSGSGGKGKGSGSGGKATGSGSGGKTTGSGSGGKGKGSGSGGKGKGSGSGGKTKGSGSGGKGKGSGKGGKTTGSGKGDTTKASATGETQASGKGTTKASGKGKGTTKASGTTIGKTDILDVSGSDVFRCQLSATIVVMFVSFFV